MKRLLEILIHINEKLKSMFEILLSVDEKNLKHHKFLLNYFIEY